MINPFKSKKGLGRGLSYNQFISGLKASGIELNRKTLAQLSINDTKLFFTLGSLIIKPTSADEMKEVSSL